MKQSLLSVLFSILLVEAYSQQDSTATARRNDSNTVTATDTAVVMMAQVSNQGNGPRYRLKPAIDIPITVVGMGWSFYAFPKIYDKSETPVQAIEALNVNNINGLDRWAAGMNNDQADKTSDFFLYGSIPVPLILLADKDIRKDAGKIGFMYLEALSVTGLFYTGSAYFVDRFRPYVYNTSLPMSERTSGNGRNSFLGGHPALVATATFFTAKVFNDYHPDSKLKWVFWGGAIAATGTTIYLRHIAGRHFPTDLFTGTTLGVLSGILVPAFHKNKSYNRHLTLLPFTGSAHGLAAIYRF
jgi:membrane-associated phospholipid phosphatase